MKRICKRLIQIDALTICFKATDCYLYNQLDLLPMGDALNTGCVSLVRIDGRYYTNIYNIIINQGDEAHSLGNLKFGLNHGMNEGNTHRDGSPKVWITLNNEELYPPAIDALEKVANILGLSLHNITTLDLCLDTPYNISKSIYRYIRRKEVTTILNGKKVLDRNEDRPELSRILSGSLNKDKYMTLCIKQRNAMRDKSKGISITTYDKSSEIRNASGKEYIMEFCGNPSRLYRTEVHLNNEEIRNYLDKYRIELTYLLFIDNTLLEDMFYHFLNSVIRFQEGRKPIKWEDILGKPKCADRYITTTPTKTHQNTSNHLSIQV